jgi:hypothetical protein
MARAPNPTRGHSISHAEISALALTIAPEHAEIMFAICLAESGGDPYAISSTGDYGLWQINRAAHADLFVHHRWQNPVDNAAMARSVYMGRGGGTTGLQAWSTYTNGAYKAHLRQASSTETKHGTKGYWTYTPTPSGAEIPQWHPGSSGKAPKNAVPPYSGQAGAAAHISLPNPLSGIEAAIGAVTNLLGKIFDPSLWKRIGIGICGAIALIVGVVMMMDETKMGHQAIKGASKIGETAALA